MSAAGSRKLEQMDEIVLHTASDTILTVLQDRIKANALSVCYPVIECLENSSISQIATRIKAGMKPHMVEMVNGIADRFEQVELPSLKHTIRTSDQGVYARIVRVGLACSIYIGSSWGKLGIRNRVIKYHLKASMRAKEPNKALYIAMGNPDAVTTFICLIQFYDTVSPGLVLLAESLCCVLFDTLDTKAYRGIRPGTLPVANRYKGLNRSDPLKDYQDGNKQLGDDSTTFNRIRTLARCQEDAIFRITVATTKPVGRRQAYTAYGFNLFKIHFTIPLDVAQRWNLEEGSYVFVHFDAINSRHEHALAPGASDEDDGKGVGIRVSTTVNSEEDHVWLTRKGQRAVKIANTLYDLFNERIVGHDYVWRADREYIFKRHGLSKEQSAVKEEKKSHATNVRLTPLNGPPNPDFVWNDPNRKPETSPGQWHSAEVEESKEEEEEEGHATNVTPKSPIDGFSDPNFARNSENRMPDTNPDNPKPETTTGGLKATDWELFFLEPNHSNQTSRELLPAALGSLETSILEDSVPWTHPAHFTLEVRKWFSGQKDVIFHYGTIFGPEDVAFALSMALKNGTRSQGLGIAKGCEHDVRHTLKSLILLQIRYLLGDPKTKCEDLLYTRIDGSTFKSKCSCGYIVYNDLQPAFACWGRHNYVMKRTVRCPKPGCEHNCEYPPSLIPVLDIYQGVNMERTVLEKCANGGMAEKHSVCTSHAAAIDISSDS